jgi:predicted ferric reductase
VIALWAVIATALLATFRRRLRLKPTAWRACHLTLATVIVTGSVVHAMLIEGTMGTLSKAALSALVVAAAVKVVVDRRPWTLLTRERARGADARKGSR